VPQIEITFDINANAFLNVSACESISERKQNIIIDVSRSISKGKRDRKVLNTLGIETKDGIFTPLIEANTAIPVKKSRVFPTSEKEPLMVLPTLWPPISKNQISVEINVFQGERELVRDNLSLDRFILDGISSAPGSVPQIEVIFDIDAKGNVNVSVRDNGTGREQRITIVASSGLSKEQIDRMVRDAEMHAAEDRRRKEEVEERNLADSAAYRAEKSITELGDKLTSEQRGVLVLKIADIRAALATHNVLRIKSAREALEQLSYKINEEIYRQRAPKGDFNDRT